MGGGRIAGYHQVIIRKYFKIIQSVRSQDKNSKIFLKLNVKNPEILLIDSKQTNSKKSFELGTSVSF